ncbi:MAG: M28 family peptidase, partial [Halothece sp.]
PSNKTDLLLELMLNLKQWIVSGCTLMGVVGLIPGQPRPDQGSIAIKPLVNEVSLANIKAHVDTLSNEIGPRDTPVAQGEAADYIAEQLKAFGYSVTRNPVDASENVIAQLPGQSNSNKLFVIGAHFDTVPNSPGADDNASAVAGMLEMARVLNRNPNYHSPQDTLNTLNLDFARKATQATLATALISSTISVGRFCPAKPE